jgi:hypothetical protein
MGKTKKELEQKKLEEARKKIDAAKAADGGSMPSEHKDGQVMEDGEPVTTIPTVGKGEDGEDIAGADDAPAWAVTLQESVDALTAAVMEANKGEDEYEEEMDLDEEGDLDVGDGEEEIDIQDMEELEELEELDTEAGIEDEDDDATKSVKRLKAIKARMTKRIRREQRSTKDKAFKAIKDEQATMKKGMSMIGDMVADVAELVKGMKTQGAGQSAVIAAREQKEVDFIGKARKAAKDGIISYGDLQRVNNARLYGREIEEDIKTKILGS